MQCRMLTSIPDFYLLNARITFAAVRIIKNVSRYCQMSFMRHNCPCLRNTDLNKWRDIPCYGSEDSMLLKISVLPKLTYKLQYNHIQIPSRLFICTDNWNQKCIWECKEPRTAEQFWIRRMKLENLYYVISRLTKL